MGENVCLDVQLKEDDNINPGLDYVKVLIPPLSDRQHIVLVVFCMNRLHQEGLLSHREHSVMI